MHDMHLQAGQYWVSAAAKGSGGYGVEMNRFFEVLEPADFIVACEEYPRRKIESGVSNWPISEVLPVGLRFDMLEDTGKYHYVAWDGSQDLCLSIRPRASTYLGIDSNEVGVRRHVTTSCPVTR